MQLGDDFGDLVVRCFERGQTQVLLIGGFQDVILMAVIIAQRPSSSAIFFA